MADKNPYGPKKTFGQKAAGFLKKLTLCTAFAAAAGGVGYNYYGSQETLTARVNSVEITQDPATGRAASAVIHTDKGDFLNERTIAYLKGAKDVNRLDDIMQPGTTVKMTVYGIPGFRGMKLEDWGILRNVIAATPVDANAERLQPPAGNTAPAEVSPAAPPAAAPPLVFPTALESPQGKDLEDPKLPETCVANDDFQDIDDHAPRLARDLSIMQRLPLTGTDVFNAISSPKNKIHSCLFPVDPKKGYTSTFQNDKARIARGSGTSTAFHEYFHALQDIHENQTKHDMYSLTLRDGTVANLLKEASAVAYELAARQEAENAGLRFYDTPSFIETTTEQKDGQTITHTVTWYETSAATNPDTRKAFKDAYDASFAANATLEAKDRETKALEAGGQAVVRRLLTGADHDWDKTYSDLALSNVNSNLRFFRAHDTDAGYVAKRDQVFRTQGGISSTINVIPDEYLGANAGDAIQKAFDALGFKIVPSKTASARPPGPHPGS